MQQLYNSCAYVRARQEGKAADAPSSGSRPSSSSCGDHFLHRSRATSHTLHTFTVPLLLPLTLLLLRAQRRRQPSGNRRRQPRTAFAERARSRPERYSSQIRLFLSKSSPRRGATSPADSAAARTQHGVALALARLLCIALHGKRGGARPPAPLVPSCLIHGRLQDVNESDAHRQSGAPCARPDLPSSWRERKGKMRVKIRTTTLTSAEDSFLCADCALLRASSSSALSPPTARLYMYCCLFFLR